MTNTTTTNKQSTFTWRKLAGIVILILFLQFPIYQIEELTSERSKLKELAGETTVQQVYDPVLKIPYQQMEQVIVNPEGGKEFQVVNSAIRHVYIPAEKTRINAKMEVYSLERGIYPLLEYHSDLEYSGNISLRTISGIQDKKFLWDQAELLVPFNRDTKIDKLESVEFMGASSPHKEALSRSERDILNGFVIYSAPLVIEKPEVELSYSTKVNITARQKLFFNISAAALELNLSGSGAVPNFTGSLIPSNRQIASSTFQADWHSNYLGNPASFSQYLDLLRDVSTVGITLTNGVDIYRLVHRVVRYQLLFFVVIFLTFVFIEIVNRNRVHPIQYLLVGAALCLFYLILLSFSEHIGFTYSYFIAALTSSLLIGGYSAAILSSSKLALNVSGMLFSSYTLLYVLIQQEDFALISGTVALTFILSLVMYKTRKIDWYSMEIKSDFALPPKVASDVELSQ